MKRIFADLHLNLNVNDGKDTSQTINKAAELGYHLIATPFTLETRANLLKDLQELCSEVGLDFVTRIDLRPRTHNQLLHYLRKLRRKFEVICVKCDNKEVARQAAKDRRVDILNFPLLDFHSRFFDSAEAELASKSLTALEIDINPLLVLEGAPRIRLLSNLRRETMIAERLHVPIIISSGAVKKRFLRKPREMAALASLFGLDEVSALEAISQNPFAIVKRNREKLSSKFVAPGIRIVKEGKDC